MKKKRLGLKMVTVPVLGAVVLSMTTPVVEASSVIVGSEKYNKDVVTAIMNDIDEISVSYPVEVKLADSSLTSTVNSQQNSLSNFTQSRNYLNNVTFKDIGDDGVEQWYTSIIRKAYEYKIIDGIGDNKFDPDGSLSVGQAITIGARMHSIYKYGEVEGKRILNDYVVANEGKEWYAGYESYAIVEGLIGDEFRDKMGEPITRSEMVHAWSKIVQSKDLPSSYDVESIVDMGSGDVYFNEVLNFYKAGLVNGDAGSGAFRPNDNIKRSECTAIFLRIIETSSRVNNTHLVPLVEKPLDQDRKGYPSGTLVGGNVESVPGGVAKPVDFSNAVATKTYKEAGILDESIAEDIAKSILETVRIQHTGLDENGGGTAYITLSVPALPENYVVRINANLIGTRVASNGQTGTTSVCLDSVEIAKMIGTQHNIGGVICLTEGNYKLPMNKGYLSVMDRFAISFKLAYVGSSGGAHGNWQSEIYDAGAENILSGSPLIRKDYFKNALDLWTTN